MTDVPNLDRALAGDDGADRYRLVSGQLSVALRDRIDRRTQKRITIKKGEPICRVIPVRRDTYFAQRDVAGGVRRVLRRGPEVAGDAWAGSSTKGTVDITRTYVRQQVRSKFVVMT